MITTTSELLGKGLYTPAEAAFYARVPTQLMNRWVHGSGGKSVIHPQFKSDDDRLVSFLDFVQALSIRAIRTTYKVSLQKIREAVDSASQKYRVEYPFAVEHRTFLLGDLQHAPQKAEVVIELPDSGDLVQLTGKAKGNKIIAEVAELHMRNLTFGEDRLAAAYVAWTDENRQITMDPHRQFGEPMVGTCGYSAEALWHAYITEGGVEKAAGAYGVASEDVESAIRYLDYLTGSALLRDDRKAEVSL